MDEADRIWEEKGYTAEKILETHRRTPYPKKNKWDTSFYFLERP